MGFWQFWSYRMTLMSAMRRIILQSFFVVEEEEEEKKMVLEIGFHHVI